MKKKFLFLPLLLVLALAGCVRQPVETNTPKTPVNIEQPDTTENNDSQKQTAETKPIELGVGIMYTDSIYGYSLNLPDTWKGYEVRSETTDWGEGVTARTFYFGFKSWDDIFAISVFDKEGFENVKDLPNSVQLGINDDYVFLGGQSQAIADPELEVRWGEVGIIFDSFKLR